jgi:hypothetical protein
MFARSWPGARAESRLHASQRRRASEGQLHASHLGHSGDWRGANERLDQRGSTFAPRFRVRQWQPHGPALPSSRTRSARPCSLSFPSASSLCGFRIVGPRSKRASDWMPLLVLTARAERSTAGHDLSKDKERCPSEIQRRFRFAIARSPNRTGIVRARE